MSVPFGIWLTLARADVAFSGPGGASLHCDECYLRSGHDPICSRRSEAKAS